MFKYLSVVADEFYGHVGEDIRELVSGGDEIPLCMYRNLRVNSYEDKFIEPYLSNEAFIWKLENAMKNSPTLTKYQLSRHYTEYLATDGVSELLRRFKEMYNDYQNP